MAIKRQLQIVSERQNVTKTDIFTHPHNTLTLKLKIKQKATQVTLQYICGLLYWTTAPAADWLLCVGQCLGNLFGMFHFLWLSRNSCELLTETLHIIASDILSGHPKPKQLKLMVKLPVFSMETILYVCCVCLWRLWLIRFEPCEIRGLASFSLENRIIVSAGSWGFIKL